MQTAADSLPGNLQKSLLCGVVIAMALIVVGRLLIPTTALISVAGSLTILLGYGWLAVIWPLRLYRHHADILHMAIRFGLLAGAVFAIEVLLEYVLLPTDNTLFGLVEFGLVFCLYFAAALVVALRTGSLKNALLSSVASAFIASLLWVIVVLMVFYIFRGSAQQALVLRAEGDYEDFARSGLSDFNAFIMEDFMGATFYHLLLGPLVAAVLGFLGGLLGKASAALIKK